MKILVVQESNWLTRNPHQQHHLMERLVLRGHEVRVIDYDIDWKKEKQIDFTTPRTLFENVHKIFPGVRIQVIRPYSLNIPFIEYSTHLITHNREIKHQITEFKPDLVIGFGILNAWMAVRLARRHAIPFIYYWIDALDALVPGRKSQWVARLLETQTLALSTKVLAINKRLGDYVISLGASPEKTTLIGAGIDLNLFDPLIDGSNIRKEFGIRDDATVLFFMGWLYHFSGLKELALALSKTKNLYPNVILLIVGDGDALPDLERIMDEHHLNGQMILTGKQPYDKIPEFLAASDICILPADPNERIMQDIVPIKIYEYMAMKKPVITTNLPGIIREFGQENGIIYSDTPEGVLEVAMRLKSTGSLGVQGEKGRKYVENLDWENVTNTFETIITEVSR